ncbi:hypothetical protein CSB08_00575 [Candidatus Gracilibacteria bacterium]|nr:MAG: hypothetical protein CSB08_00575 [Candidatus Gracilibacteria bacterium]PIE84870.1 MAG: hypothetical protein CSA08_04910 [Candidatus Gracilibacteria bacterium]
MQDFLNDLDDELSKINYKPEKENNKKTNKTAKEIEAIKRANENNPNHPSYIGKKDINKEITKTSQTKTNNVKPSNKDIRSVPTLNFPETKFFLPSLRDGYTRFMPIGGNDETGAKNMGMFQYGEDIILVDCGIQFTDYTTPGTNYSIPDVSFLTKYTKNIKAFFITHAHLDHIGALKHILPALDFPPIYGTKLTLGIIRKSLEESKILDKVILIEVDAGSEETIETGGFKIEFFKVNHSVPDCAGLYIESRGGARFMHTGDFKIDYTPAIDEPANLERIENLGRRGITMLLSDSTGSNRKGFSMSEKNVGEALEEIVSNHKRGRLIIATFSSWISRVQQLVDICEKYDKTIFLSGRSMIENVKIATELGYLKVKKGIIKKMTPKATEGILPHKQVIITTGSQGEQFSALTRMAEGKHTSIEIIKGDTVVFSSSVVPGNDVAVVKIINKLIMLGADVLTKNDGEYHTGGHAFVEEQKIMIKLVKAKYFCPIYGDLYYRTLHKKTAIEAGMKDENVLLVSNGQISDFAPSGVVFRSKIKAPIQQVIIDGHGIGLATSHVIKAREQMMNSGVLVINYKIDKKTKAIMGHLKLETRGLVYLEEVRYIHRIIIKKSREIYENTIKDIPDISEKDLLKIIKTDLELFLLKRIDRTPMIIPIITEV